MRSSTVCWALAVAAVLLLATYHGGYVTGRMQALRSGQEHLVESGTHCLERQQRLSETAFRDLIEDETFRLINEERRKAGLEPFHLSEKLRMIVRTRSEQNLLFKHAIHNNPITGEMLVVKLFDQAGYRYEWAAENAYYREGYDLDVWRESVPLSCLSEGQQATLLASRAVEGWLTSTKGHRRLIYWPESHPAGVGVAIQPSMGAYTVTLVVTRP